VRARPSNPPTRRVGWTAADAAELDVLIWALVEGVPEHRARCKRCEAQTRTGFSCPAVGEAIEAVLGWVAARRLLSRAEYLRRQEEGRAT
jgi:hypothetical protein